MSALALGTQLGGTIGSEIDDLVLSGKARQVGITATLPSGMQEVTLSELKSLFDPWYKKWWIWAIAGTAVVGGVVLYRRRRS